MALRKNSAVDLAWAAGIVDDLYALHVLVGQSGFELPKMLKKLHLLFGGNVTLTPYKPKDAHRKPKWYWQVTSITAERVILQILPYLEEKRDQADVALRYRRECIIGPGKRSTDRQKELARGYYLKLREMKTYRKTHEKWRVKDV